MGNKKALIFDSGAIITLALNNLLYILEPLKKIFKGEFYIPDSVKVELVDKPLNTKRFMLEALMIKFLLKKGIFTVISTAALKRETKRIMALANHTFNTKGEWIRLVHEGETSCLALYNLINAQNKALVIDERTTRMLCESPKNLRKLFERKLDSKVEAIEANYSFFKNFKIIRSSELAFIAYKKGIIKLPTKSKKAIEALLYAAKYKGCAISNHEIEIAKKL